MTTRPIWYRLLTPRPCHECGHCRKDVWKVGEVLVCFYCAHSRFLAGWIADRNRRVTHKAGA